MVMTGLQYMYTIGLTCLVAKLLQKYLVFRWLNRLNNETYPLNDNDKTKLRQSIQIGPLVQFKNNTLN